MKLVKFTVFVGIVATFHSMSWTMIDIYTAKVWYDGEKVWWNFNAICPPHKRRLLPVRLPAMRMPEFRYFFQSVIFLCEERNWESYKLVCVWATLNYQHTHRTDFGLWLIFQRYGRFCRRLSTFKSKLMWFFDTWHYKFNMFMFFSRKFVVQLKLFSIIINLKIFKGKFSLVISIKKNSNFSLGLRAW